ncbi:MAG: bifunctional diaminohydroxyphosphoribosylaminopyrimidine deaminase/5-amino-6-(5-phosphoribosylamino)uracil reductase RibD [Paenibacillaceae bacterium]|nr:bifunctional diaminohydroxyphosphoribosylaminopyrimidine deaminase/5-amino-6-(5-phosphoribosylamino)uracil reductase RibD [Paenibacillaceae bacterium]
MEMTDEEYMRLACTLAGAAIGQTGTNPVVGAVVVRDGRIVGIGAHLRQGEPHAEVHALGMAHTAARGATLYVTLEPCAHTGLTPPCTDAIRHAGIARVVIGCVDPDPRCRGKGIAALARWGISVTCGVLPEQTRALIASFAHRIETNRPYVTLKMAMSLDGALATSSGESKWMTGERTRAAGRALRHMHDAIAIGIGTARADDPLLTVRTEGGRDPVRIVFDSQLRLPPTARLLAPRNDGAPTAIVCAAHDAPRDAEDALRARGAHILRTDAPTRVDAAQALTMLAAMRIGSVLVEGGGILAGALLELRLVQRVVAHIAPMIVGDGAKRAFVFDGSPHLIESIRFSNVSIDQIDDDIVWSGTLDT